jgi:hypothetical protein
MGATSKLKKFPKYGDLVMKANKILCRGLVLALLLVVLFTGMASANGVVLKTWWFSGPIDRSLAYSNAQVTVRLYASMGIKTHIAGPTYVWRTLAPNGGYYQVHKNP